MIIKIKSCESINDHTFVMIQPDPKMNQWCIMDRWIVAKERPDYYFCGVTIDEKTAEIKIEGNPVDNHYYQNVICKDMTVPGFYEVPVEEYFRRYPNHKRN